MALVYATRQELVDYTPAEHKPKIPEEPEATRLLTAASKEILRATRTAFYETDAAGYPTKTAVREAFRDATCAQALWWTLNKGEEVGTSDEYSTVSIGSVTLTKANGGAGQTDRDDLAPRAVAELELAGLALGGASTACGWTY